MVYNQEIGRQVDNIFNEPTVYYGLMNALSCSPLYIHPDDLHQILVPLLRPKGIVLIQKKLLHDFPYTLGSTVAKPF